MKEKLWRLLRNPAMGDIRHWAKPCRRTVWTLCVLEVLFSACSLLVTLETKGLVDGATGQDMRRLQVCAVLLLLTVLMKRGLALLTNLLSVKANAALQKSLQANVLRTLMKKQYASLTAFHSGELVSRMLSDVQVVKNGILEILPGMARVAVSFFGAAILLLTMDWRLVVILIAGGLLGVILVAVLETPMKKRHTAVQEAQEKYHASLQETLENLLLVKAGGGEERMQRQIGQKQEQLAQAQRKRGNFSAWMNQGITLAFQLSWVLCLLWGGLGIYRGSMTYGMLAAMLQLVNLVQGPISAMTGIAGQAYAALISAERIRELTELPQEPEGTPIASGDFAELRMEDVSFAYEKDTDPVLHRASCTLHAGDFAAITGISGEGKTTLFRLLLGVYQPNSGSLELRFREAGHERTVPVGVETRKHFAYVPQGNTLFSGTLRENLTMFAQNADDSQIREAVRVACVDELVDSLPEGLDTVLGERGVGLSEGQAQRIAIARAILTQAPILLLDESTSALDEGTEAKLLANLSRLPGRTCLIVTHRKAALEICDTCIHVERGTLTVHRLTPEHPVQR